MSHSSVATSAICLTPSPHPAARRLMQNLALSGAILGSLVPSSPGPRRSGGHPRACRPGHRSGATDSRSFRCRSAIADTTSFPVVETSLRHDIVPVGSLLVHRARRSGCPREKLRREEVRRGRAGESPEHVASALSRTDRWLRKWVACHGEDGQDDQWAQARSGPHSSPARTPDRLRDQILAARARWWPTPAQYDSTFASEPTWPPRSPALWLGQLAILFLGLHPGWFPVAGRTNPRSHYRGLEAHPRRCGPPRPSCPRGPRIRPPHTRAAGSALAVGRRRPSVSRRSRTSPIGATATLLPATSAASRPTTSNSGTRSTEKERANIGLEGRMTKLA